MTWVAWVTRIEPHFSDEWKTLGIFYSIKLSTFEINMDRELLMAALSFRCSATNTMVHPLGPIGPTVLDITAILGTSPSGLPIDTKLSHYQFDLDLKTIFDDYVIEVLTKKHQELSKEDMHKLPKNFFNYITLINHFAGSEKEDLKKGEHEAFLFYWYNKFIICTKSNKCLVENMPMAEALATGHVLGLSLAILANLNRWLVEASVGKIDPHIFKYFFGLKDLSDDKFLIFRHQKYLSSIKLPASAWEET
ncbi:hypothetical protein D8674_013453 [Pyrus ussuriensis x Pyrus communis]|uniref:Aminotransferase-like plant mobile domain-containing protein n=1 Tax=Pyrus ussuriensis x Pyrus communis TaxID=2448454 RepID=A0A5N5H3B2_9ROSA|nr:hypothetical protein D8674_013453 [Pyrus ussuriensis x Pyrus communis]